MQQKQYKKYIETQLNSYVHKHILYTNARNDANITQVSAFHYVRCHIKLHIKSQYISLVDKLFFLIISRLYYTQINVWKIVYLVFVTQDDKKQYQYKTLLVLEKLNLLKVFIINIHIFYFQKPFLLNSKQVYLYLSCKYP